MPYLCREGEGTTKLHPPFCMLLRHQDTSRARMGVQISDTETYRYEVLLEATGEL